MKDMKHLLTLEQLLLEMSDTRQHIADRVWSSFPAILEHLIKLVFLDHSRDWDGWVRTIAKMPVTYTGVKLKSSNAVPNADFYMEYLFYGPLCDNDKQPNRDSIKKRINILLEDDQYRKMRRKDTSETAQDRFVNRLEGFLRGLSESIADESLTKAVVERLLAEHLELTR